MYLVEFRLYGYKSILDSSPIKLKPGFNILTGQNNAGKTALLEGLGLRFANIPHRSRATVPTPGSRPEHVSRALFQIAITHDELQRLFQSIRHPLLALAVPHSSIPAHVDSTEVCSYLSSQQEIRFDLACGYLEGTNSLTFQTPPSIFRDDAREHSYHYVIFAKGKTTPTLAKAKSGLNATDQPQHIGEQCASQIYSFRAERLKIGVARFGSQDNLLPDAQNLPQVLHVLQSANPSRFARYNSLVKRVFPQVEWINTIPRENNQEVEILAWPVTPQSERSDLTVPLTQSGTGIGQVLAMLYVLVTSDQPRTILIDEPNSFLHPGAVRVLMEILRNNPQQHQYIITTHSPELISATNPSTVHVIRCTQGVSSVESVNTREARNLRALLMEVGSRFSDVFGAENVLWVEGPTEQLCFPLIVQQILKRPLSGISIVGVLHTGDFDASARKNTRSIYRIYQRLTQEGNALLPPAIAFIFDRELRPERDIQDLQRESKGPDGVPRVHFLNRRTYENYLIHAGAITSVLNTNPPFSDTPVLEGTVQAWLDAHINDPTYYGKEKAHTYPEEIDAPRLLKDLFSELSSNRLTYNKVEHSLALTEWLLTHSPDALKEIADLISKVLPPPQ